MSRSKDDHAVAPQRCEVIHGTPLLEVGEKWHWKLEKSGELGAAEVAAAVGAGGHIVLRTDVANGKTAIYFAGESEDERAKAIRADATEIKLVDVTK